MISSVNTARSSFRNSYKKLDSQTKELVKNALIDLIKSPIPARYRFEKLNCYKNPNIFTIHITTNHSHKLSFEVVDSVAVLRRVATHKEIDRAP